MRLALLLVSVLATAAFPAHAAWNEYVYSDLGIAKDFPAPPTLEKTTYKAPLAKEAPETVLSVIQSGVIYKVTVVDFQMRAAEGANLLGEAESTLTQGKGIKATLIDIPLYDKGANSVYGSTFSIDKMDGEHSLASFFFNKGRLYIVQIVVPAGNPNKQSPDLARFMPSLRFYLQGYGFDVQTGHDYPIGDDQPEDRDTRVIPGYKPPPDFNPAPDQPFPHK
jgi:hypothetical protein